jgi:hypothetical protein
MQNTSKAIRELSQEEKAARAEFREARKLDSEFLKLAQDKEWKVMAFNPQKDCLQKSNFLQDNRCMVGVAVAVMQLRTILTLVFIRILCIIISYWSNNSGGSDVFLLDFQI